MSVFLFLFLSFFLIVQISLSGSFQLLHCQTWGQGLLHSLCLLFVSDDKGLKISATSDFKLHIIFIFLDLDTFGILFPVCGLEVLDFLKFLRHGYNAQRACC